MSAQLSIAWWVGLLSFGIIASSASTQAGLTNWDSFFPTGDDYATLGFGNGTAVIQRSGGGPLGYSTDLTASITTGGSVTTRDNGITFNGGVWHIPGGVTDTHRIAFSTNGTSWGTALNVTAQTGDDIRAISYSGSLWVAPVYNDNDVYTSTSGTAFTLQSGVLASSTWNESTWNSSVFGVYLSSRRGATASTSYYTSTNGTTWTSRTLPAAPVSQVTAGSGVVMYVASGGVVYTSASGTAFAIAGTAPFALTDANSVSKLGYGSGIWVYAGKRLAPNNGTALSFYSADNGASWSTATFSTPITANNFDLAFDAVGNDFYMIADGGTVTNVYRASVS